jgi:hypothetical protein
MSSLYVTGSVGRPAPITSAMVMMTRGVDAMRREVPLPDLDRALAIVTSGGPAARSVLGWWATFHADDPTTEPDLWIRRTCPIVWIKRDDHVPYEPAAAGMCSWCGQEHAGVMVMFTVLLPEEY